MTADGAREPIDRASPAHTFEKSHPPALTSAAEVDLLAWVKIVQIFHGLRTLRSLRLHERLEGRPLMVRSQGLCPGWRSEDELQF
jgi:hypothetical protein